MAWQSYNNSPIWDKDGRFNSRNRPRESTWAYWSQVLRWKFSILNLGQSLWKLEEAGHLRPWRFKFQRRPHKGNILTKTSQEINWLKACLERIIKRHRFKFYWWNTLRVTFPKFPWHQSFIVPVAGIERGWRRWWYWVELKTAWKPFSFTAR